MSELVKRMAADLVAGGIDLGDERAVIVHLMNSGYSSGDIVTDMDAAIDRARSGGVSITEILGSASAAIFAVGVWLAWYCVVCPQVSA
jgi:hypothetical protein